MTHQQQLPVNTAFSTQVPGLQLAWDSTSLSALKTCPRYYQLTIVQGWEPTLRSAHLSFGIWLHSARERYYHARASGASHDDALDSALCYVLAATWEEELGRPWMSEEPTKTRLTLVRTLVWYCDQWEDDPLSTAQLDNGKPAVELSFSFDSGIQTKIDGTCFQLCGHLDRIVEYEGRSYGSDLKTTKHSLDAHYFSQFTPDNQMSLYTFAGKVVWHKPLSGMIIDGAQVLVNGSRFMRGQVGRSDPQLEEWYRDLGWWLSMAELYATANYWPMNDKACFRCPFREICSKSPSVRDGWLKDRFRRRVWDPLVARGDI